MITTEELQEGLVYEFESDTDELVYRKYTTDTIPEYVVRLDNVLDAYYLRVYPIELPEYVNLFNYETNRPIPSDEGFLMPPTSSLRVLVKFDLDKLNVAPETVPSLQFDFQAMEIVVVPGATPTLTPTATPTLTPTPTPYSGGGGNFPPPEDENENDRLLPADASRLPQVI